jgi:hypothetical protein
VAVVNHQATNITGVANTAADTWHKTTSSPFTPSVTSPNVEEIWYTLSTKGNASDIVTATLNASQSYGTIAVFEFKASAGVFGYLADSTGSGSSTAISTGTLTISAPAVITAIYLDDNVGAPTSPSGTQNSEDGSQFVWDSYQLTSSSGAASATISATNWMIIAASFTEIMTLEWATRLPPARGNDSINIPY